MSKLPFRVEWKGKFHKESGDKRTFKLGFGCNSEEAASEVVAGYVEALVKKGWVLDETDFRINPTKAD